ncbi:helix-turn-helix transcriptional regulator [Streptomyces sp. AV19]|uniref:PadR family transcriptional regulator n=1 Tax=Streptomyces sp. AV19 TaxID=2793068 RepID=UPI0018FE538A|nr:PadR family transcriptional regulator [Streptomyces sp. AV19]MBH1938083.1 helix-turn-helix transcriptional regulator [Streptomyces sp. AV19]MDG4533579.1 PadR family transcriptional regulator [Streptomyces sp. AV19]
MPLVFAHGRLRLYLLTVLDEVPRHGYEIIRLLEERFQGLYAPSAGTVYPRLAKLEAEGLVTHVAKGGRKVYSLTAAGRAELADRQPELLELEVAIRHSVAELAADIRADVHGAAGDLRREMSEAAGRLRTEAAGGLPGDCFAGATEELQRAKEEWRAQILRAKEQSRRTRRDAQRARRQAWQAQERARDEVLHIKERVQEQVREHIGRGDWPAGLAEGIGVLVKELGALAGKPYMPGPAAPVDRMDEAPLPGWGTADESTSADPSHDLGRLLDRFCDEIRDAVRDHGLTAAQLTECRKHLATAMARVAVVLDRRCD